MRYWKRWSRVILAGCLAAACVFPSYGTKTDIDDAKKKVTSLETEKKEMEQTLNELEGLKQDTAAYVKKLDSKLENLGNDLDSLTWQITAKEEDIAATQAELEDAKKVEEHQYQTMKMRIKYTYERGETSYIDLLIQSEDLSQLLNRAEYVSQIAEYDRRMLDQYIETKTQIAEEEIKLEEEHTQLLSLQEDTKAKQASVETLMNEKSTELKNYENRIGATENEITEHQKDIEAQENHIKQIEAEIKRKEEEARKAAEAAGKKYNTVSIGNIKFIWPCPSSSRITSGFGGRSSPTEGASSNHQGLDIGAPSGSSIVAAASGTVTIATYSYSAGNYIMLNHGGGVSTVYMHCSQLLVSEGQEVKQGQVIAKVGSTGYSTGPHLHFGVRLNGSYVNPAKYVSP